MYMVVLKSMQCKKRENGQFQGLQPPRAPQGRACDANVVQGLSLEGCYKINDTKVLADKVKVVFIFFAIIQMNST